MNRRGFLAALLGGAVLDPERLLWRPGAKLISIPKAAPLFTPVLTPEYFRLGDIITMKGYPGQYVVTQVGKAFSDVRFVAIGPPVFHPDKYCSIVPPIPYNALIWE